MVELSFVTEIETLFKQLSSLAEGYLELALEKGKGLLEFVNYIFTKCLPDEYQGLFLFLFVLLILLGYLRHVK